MPIDNITRPNTTFHMDFAIAEAFGANAVKDTYKRAHDGWKNNVAYYTELVMCLNHRLGMHDMDGRDALAKVYNDLYLAAHDFACENFKGDDLRYYLAVTD